MNNEKDLIIERDALMAAHTGQPGSRSGLRDFGINRSLGNLNSRNENKPTTALLFSTFVILTGSSFLFGYNLGVLNQPVKLIREFYADVYTARTAAGQHGYGQQHVTSNTTNGDHVTTADSDVITLAWSLTNAMFFPGGMIGAFAAGYLADKYGRNKGMMIMQAFSFIGAIFSFCSLSVSLPEFLIIGRFITGIHAGLATQLAPMYITEVAPRKLRGTFGTAHQLFITVGILTGSVMGLSDILGTESYWPYLLLLNCVPSIVSLILLPFVPESPRFLMINRCQRNEAETSLQFFRSCPNVTNELEEIAAESIELNTKLSDNNYDNTFTMKKLFTTRHLRIPLAIGVGLQIMQQFSGINAIFFYSTGIYANAGVAAALIQYAVVLTNCINVMVTIVAVHLMDKTGRRPLMIFPMIGMVFVLAVLTVSLNFKVTVPWLSYVSVGSIIAYVVCFGIGLGPIPMMIGTELFRQEARARAMSLIGLTNWLATTVVALCFEFIQEEMQDMTFLVFMVLMIVFTVVIYYKVPETKHKTVEEIAKQF